MEKYPPARPDAHGGGDFPEGLAEGGVHGVVVVVAPVLGAGFEGPVVGGEPAGADGGGVVEDVLGGGGDEVVVVEEQQGEGFEGMPEGGDGADEVVGVVGGIKGVGVEAVLEVEVGGDVRVLLLLAGDDADLAGEDEAAVGLVGEAQEGLGLLALEGACAS